MEGYEVVTFDDEKLGQVVTTAGGNVIVEYGLLRKTRRAVPESFTTVHEDERLVRVSVSKEIVEDSPDVGDGVDEAAVAEHYGLAGSASTAPGAEGYGELNDDDPVETADDLAFRSGLETAGEERTRIRESMRSGSTDSSGGRPIIPPDPHR